MILSKYRVEGCIGNILMYYYFDVVIIDMENSFSLSILLNNILLFSNKFF